MVMSVTVYTYVLKDIFGRGQLDRKQAWKGCIIIPPVIDNVRYEHVASTHDLYDYHHS